MDITKCKILLEAIDCGSLSGAAAKLGYTTAGVSYNVDAIENELGFPIIRRKHSGIALTASGEKILPLLRELVQVEERMGKRATELRKALNGEVTIGTFNSIATHLMPEILRDFQKEYPEVSIKINEGVQMELEDLLAKGEVDFCLCSYQKKNKQHWIPLRKDPEVCVIPPDHPLAQKERIAPLDLRDEPLIIPAHGKDPDVLDLFKRFKMVPNAKYTTVDTDTAVAMVEHSFGILVANEMTSIDRVKKAVIRPFEPEQYILEGIYVNSMEELSPPARRLVKFLEDRFAGENKD